MRCGHPPCIETAAGGYPRFRTRRLAGRLPGTVKTSQHSVTAPGWNGRFAERRRTAKAGAHVQADLGRPPRTGAANNA
jgi:hypothetical protein